MSETMTAVDLLKENLRCSICLELFTRPLTLPCGHTFCQACIHGHWDNPNPLCNSIKCPDCREEFPQRPEPQKNVSLNKVLEDLKEMEQEKLVVAPMLTESGPKRAKTLCPTHNQEFILYCRTEKRCICCKCMLKNCQIRNHDLVEIEEQCEKERGKLSNDFEANGCKKVNTEKEIEEWGCKSQMIKDSNNILISRLMTKFDQVQKALEKCRTLVVESVRCEEKVALAQVSNHLQDLQQHLKDLNKYHMKAEQLLDSRMSEAEFLENLPLLAPVGCVPASPTVQLCGTVQMDAVTSVLPDVSRLLQEELPNALYPVATQPDTREISGRSSTFGIISTYCPTQTSRPLPAELKTDPTPMSPQRTQLFQDYRNLRFDPDTANRFIVISHENCKATHKTSLRHSVAPQTPKRFESWQVMCMEGYSTGSHYWEVDISTDFLQIGVAYESIKRTKERQNQIGRNRDSWSLDLRSMSQSVWHDNKELLLKAPKYRRIGLHLDFTEGSITFYGIKDEVLECLHSFHSVFLEKLYPVFWIGEDVNVKLHHVMMSQCD